MGGAFQLFVGNGTERRMLHRMELAGARRPLVLEGYKVIRDDPGPDMWFDTRTLFVSVRDGAVFHLYFTERRGWSKVATGAVLGLFCGVLWDSLQGGLIEYATATCSGFASSSGSASTRSRRCTVRTARRPRGGSSGPAGTSSPRRGGR